MKTFDDIIVETVEIGGRIGCHRDEGITSGLTEKASWPRFALPPIIVAGYSSNRN
jgi:hypothetical protein